MRFVTRLEIVIWNPRAQVVNMVETDIAAKPLQDRRELVKRGPLERLTQVAPILVALPVGIFELVLNVEQPNTRRPRDEHDRHLNH